MAMDEPRELLHIAREAVVVGIDDDDAASLLVPLQGRVEILRANAVYEVELLIVFGIDEDPASGR
jgi:hypothetical protein